MFILFVPIKKNLCFLKMTQFSLHLCIREKIKRKYSALIYFRLFKLTSSCIILHFISQCKCIHFLWKLIKLGIILTSLFIKHMHILYENLTILHLAIYINHIHLFKWIFILSSIFNFASKISWDLIIINSD